jgi:uncharacterized membrane protein YeaQ/YmgE (transglycosylase-associated protein family)
VQGQQKAGGKRELHMNMHPMVWYALVGWVAGWVTGRAMKGVSRGSFGDAILGMLGGLGGGWLMRHTNSHGNWGFLVAVLVATAAGALLTWIVRKIGEVWQHRHPQQQQERHA